MYIDKLNIFHKNDSIEDKLKRFEILKAEANTVREKDKILIRSLFRSFYNKHLNVGIGFQRAYGSVLAGDYFDLIRLPDNKFLFIFADISGHGLPAYTTLIRLRSAITIAIKSVKRYYEKSNILNTTSLVRDICIKFTDIMDEANSDDYACVNFTFISHEDDKFKLKFYNRGMLFPIVIRKKLYKKIDIYNLNLPNGKWIPQVGYILGSHVRKLLKNAYLETPSCEYVLYELDSILFFSDGITEAYNPDLTGKNESDEFGIQRVEQIIRENYELSPQEIVNKLFAGVYDFLGDPERQKDDMTAILIDFPPVNT